MSIYKSGEDYLETILILSRRNGNVRSVDIAHELNFKKSSVSVAMKNLRLNNYITINDNGYILLTESGLEIATKIYERHTILTDFLKSIGVNEEVAAEDACKIEHDLSSESFDALKKFISEHPVK
ncbi:metal-dependent transcriptional regulator [Lachnospiraceae bacterium HCP1S3_C3]|nr:metal-dependent transcriptional regulator [Lachnospiraceae bacterium]MDD6856893.1 metal-dependent transcriptional regulator [Lachnospiraceae bacterium]